MGAVGPLWTDVIAAAARQTGPADTLSDPAERMTRVSFRRLEWALSRSGPKGRGHTRERRLRTAQHGCPHDGAVRARPRDHRLRAAVVEVRRLQGDGHQGALRHELDALLPGAQRAHRPPGAPSSTTRCSSSGCAGCAPAASGPARPVASAWSPEPAAPKASDARP